MPMSSLILSVNGLTPQLGPGCWLAPNATLVGDVVLGAGCTVWFGAVVRGDVNAIRIGDHTNIQDVAVLHCTYQRADLRIGARVSIGHRALVHGCHIDDDVLIGMGAIVMDHAQVGAGCIIAAGAVVLENQVCEPGWLYAGVPAKRIKPVTDEQRAMIARTATNYQTYAGWFE
ncbi:MAG: gamma carbonic anhydrase family protein [Hymenobacteraceae bacterium]|nr:gamma carbonic anhydrase family protein [Hymenobacteraceae bacterium]